MTVYLPPPVLNLHNADSISYKSTNCGRKQTLYWTNWEKQLCGGEGGMLEILFQLCRPNISQHSPTRFSFGFTNNSTANMIVHCILLQSRSARFKLSFPQVRNVFISSHVPLPLNRPLPLLPQPEITLQQLPSIFKISFLVQKFHEMCPFPINNLVTTSGLHSLTISSTQNFI